MRVAGLDLRAALPSDGAQVDDQDGAVTGDLDRLDLLVELRPGLEEGGQEALDLLPAVQHLGAWQLPALAPFRVRVKDGQRAVR